MLLLLIGATACSEHSRVNTLTPLSETSTSNQYILLSEDSIIELVSVNLSHCPVINIPNKDKEACLDTIFASYSFVPLETTERSTIGRIEKIIVCQDCFCILDRDNSNVFLFELNGKFRCRLGAKGHGAGEHLDAWNVAYDEKNRELVLLDLSGRKLMYYNLFGELLRVAPMYYLYTCLEYQNENMILGTFKAYNRSSDILDLYQLVVADRNQKPISLSFKTSETIRQTFSHSPRLKKCGEEVIFDDLLSDTLWRISSGSKTPLAIFNFKSGSHFSSKDKRRMTDRLYSDKSDQVGCVINWNATPQYISLLVSTQSTGKRVFNVLYSRKTGKYKLFGKNTKPTRLGDFFAYSSFDGVYDPHTFIRIVEPTDILENCHRPHLQEIMSTVEKKMTNSLSVDDNPILMIEHLIDF